MAKFDAKVRKCFATATSISDADAKKLAAMAEKYASGDETADYASAISDEISRYTGYIDQIMAKVSGKEAAKPDNAAPATVEPDKGGVATVESDKTVTVGRKGREQEVNARQMLQLINNATPQERAIIMARTGFDLDQDPDNGAPIMVQVSNPRSLQEVADALGLKNRQNVDNVMAKFGLTDERVNALAGSFAADTVTTEELGIDPAADGSGFRIEDEVSKTAGQGLVDDGNALSKAQKEQVAKADELLAEKGTKGKKQGDNYDSTTDPTRAKREAEAAASLRRDVASQLATQSGKLAASDWGELKSDGVAEFDSLPPNIQNAWMVEYSNHINEQGYTDATAEAFQRQFERDNDVTEAAPDTRGGAGADADAGRAGGSPAARANRGNVGDGTGGPILPQDDQGDRGQRPLSEFGPRIGVTIGGVTYDTVEVQDREAFFQAHPGYAAGLQQLESAGLGFTLERVDAIRVSDDKVDGAEAAVDYEVGTGVILYLSRQGSNTQHAYNLRHEVGHVLDGAFGNKPLAPYSSRPEVAFAPNGTPLGEVARLAVREAKSGSPVGSAFAENALTYLPSDPVRASEELVADLLAIASKDARKLPPGLRKFALEMLADAKANGEKNIGAAKFQASKAGKTSAPRSNPAARYNRAAVPPSVAKAESAIGSAMQSVKDATSWTALRTMFTKDLVNLAPKSMQESVQAYFTSMVKVTTERAKAENAVTEILQGFRKLSNAEQGTGPSSVNALLKDSTMSKKWAFKPDWLPNGVELDPVLEQRFKTLSPQAQEMVKRVFKHGHDNLKTLQAAVLDNTSSEYDALISELEANGETAEAEVQRQKKAKSLNDFQTLLDIRGNWPYAPLKRFGNHVVLAVSKAYKDAEAAKDTKLMQELQQSGDHYYVSFADTMREARKMAQGLESNFPDGYVEAFEKAPTEGNLYGGRDMLGAFERLRRLAKNQTEDEVDAKTSKRVDDLMRNLYLTLLSETSARKGEIHRKNIAGADNDMMRAFATQGRATAHFLASLRTNGSIQDNLRDMQEEARGGFRTGRTERQAYFNEILRRHSMGLEYEPAGLIDKAMGFTSVFTLLSNPSYYLVNALQPGMMSQPLMAARHGYGRAWGELNRAYREMLPVLKAGPLTDKSFGKLPADVREAMTALADGGIIDLSFGTDFGSFESDQTGPSKVYGSVVEKLRGVAQRVESMNRLSTAIAAYRLERTRTGSSEAALTYAKKVIYETHGDYSGFNSPRFMRQGVMRLATQFRKFQLIQLSMFARFVHQAFKGATADERAVGRKALLFNLSHLAVMGGAMGLPGFTAIAWIVGKAMPDDDEPDDPEATLRRILGEDNKFVADMLIKGVPKALGVDLSGRIGAGGMLSIAPYADLDLSRKGYAETAVAMLGPFAGGLLPRAADGLGLMGKGDYYKGLEQLLPSGLANMAKGARFAVDGVTSRKGEQLLTSDEIGILDGLAQAAGLPTNIITDRNSVAGSLYKAETFYKDRVTQLKKDYVEAVRSNDAEAMVEARQDWTSLQEAKRGLGFKPSPLSDLLKAPQEMRKREANVVAGVSAKKESAGFLRQLAE